MALSWSRATELPMKALSSTEPEPKADVLAQPTYLPPKTTQMLLLFRLDPTLLKWECLNPPGYATTYDFSTFELSGTECFDSQFREDVLAFLGENYADKYKDIAYVKDYSMRMFGQGVDDKHWQFEVRRVVFTMEENMVVRDRETEAKAEQGLLGDLKNDLA